MSLEHRALVARLRVEADAAVDAVAHRRGEHFAVGDVPLAPAGNHGNALDRELQLRAGRDDPHAVGLPHALGQRLLGFLHRGVVGRAHVEVKIFERGRAHVGRLGERIGRIAQHDPLGLRRRARRCARSATSASGRGPSSPAARRRTGCCWRPRGCRCTPAPAPCGPFQTARPASCFPRWPFGRATAARRSISTSPAAPHRGGPRLPRAGKPAPAPADRRLRSAPFRRP